MKDDDDFRPHVDVVEFAEQVLSMHHRLMRQERELEELREYRGRYLQSLNDGIAHSRHIMGGMLELAMTPGVLDACAAANKAKRAAAD